MITDLYAQKKYDEILEKYLENTLNCSFNRTNRKFPERFIELKFTLYSCYHKGYFFDCIKLLKKAMIIIPFKEDYWSPQERVNMLEVAFFSLLYTYFNFEDSDFSDKDRIKLGLDQVLTIISHTYESANFVLDERLQKHIHLYKEYQSGKQPLYVVKFLYPYEPPITASSFDLKPCFPFMSLKIDKVPREFDCFTSFEFTILGYTNADTFWEGPTWKNRERFPVVKKILPLLNMMLLLIAEATPGRFITPYCIEQVSSVEIYQYPYKGGEATHCCIGTDFTAQWVGGNVPKRTFCEQELQYLNQRLINTYQAKPFVRLYHQAKNNISAGLYVESFLLFCTCAEALLYHWCDIISNLCGKQTEYKMFTASKFSACDRCDFWNNSKSNNKPDKGREPTAFRYIDFLEEVCGLSKANAKRLKHFFSKARNDNLRNDVVHGRSIEVTLSQLKESEKALFDMQNLFVDIQKKITQCQ